MQYEKAITEHGDDWTAMNNFARLLATCPDARFRDGKRAVSIAMEVYQKNPQECTLYVIAAAYAETGDFTSATNWAYKARDVPGYDRVAIEKMLAEFKLGRACRWQGTLDRWK